MAVLGKICRKAILDNPTGQCWYVEWR